MTITAPDTTLNGTFTDDQGNTISGTLTFILQGYGASVPKIAGVQMLPGLSFTAAVTSGVFSVSFYSNQIITPGPLITFYTVSFVASGAITNQVFNFVQNYQFGPGTFDISQLVPLNQTVSNTSTPNTITVKTFAPQSHKFLTGLSSTGDFTAAQPTAADISTTAAFTSPILIGLTDTGLSRTTAGRVAVGNGTQGDTTGTFVATNFLGNLFGMGSGPGADDVGLSRISAGVAAIGNGSAGDFSGTLKLAAIQGASLTGVSSGNNATLVNAQNNLAPLTGNSADQNFFSFTIPGNTVATGKAVRVTATWKHSTGTAAITYKLFFGGVLIANYGAIADTINSVYSTSVLLYNEGTTTAKVGQYFTDDSGVGHGNGNYSHGIAVNMASNQAVAFSFNVANTDQVTPDFFLVELVQ